MTHRAEHVERPRVTEQQRRPRAVAILSWAVGAGLAYYWTQVTPLPFGATVPVFAVTFALYLLAGLATRRKPAVHPGPQASTPTDTSMGPA